MSDWPDPTPEMLATLEFEKVWQCIKRWDINVPDAYAGYCGATGNHVRAILDSLTPDEGRVPDREAFWLVERKVQPSQYVGAIAQWTTDPWVARRFDTEREAHDYWRLMSIFRDESAVVEHMFLNKQTP